MTRDLQDSPDYSAPRQRRFTPPQARSPSASHRSRARRSRSPVTTRGRAGAGERRRRSSSRSRSRGSSRSLQESDLSREDENALRSLHCAKCRVGLHDQASMMAHLKGKPHLAQLRRLEDLEVRQRTGGLGMSDLLRPSREVYPSDYWNREKGSRRLRPEQERFLDTKRFDRVEPKFDRETYRQSRPSEKELYCSDCDVWVKTRDQMQAHKEGKDHRRRTTKVKVFQCKMCLITVPCQDTLDNHMKGQKHIKRATELREARKARGEISGREEEEGGYRTGPLEMASLDNNEREELLRLRTEISILQGKYRESLREKEELRKQVRFYKDNHNQEDRKPKREPEEQKPSISHLRREYFEHEENDFDVKMK